MAQRKEDGLVKDRRASTFGSRCAAAALALLFPPRCLTCGADEDAVDFARRPLICDTCRQEMFTLDQPKCRRCAAPVAAQLATRADCPWCQKAKFHFERVVALGVYRGRLRDAVLRTKNSRQEAISLALGTLLGQLVEKELPDQAFNLIVPVPMSFRRRLLRGVNGPELLAEGIARVIYVPIRRALVVRRQHAKQSLLPRSERPGNVRGAFGVAQRAKLEGAEVLLVDDTLTTGSTANEAAREMRAAGARRVVVATVARSIGAA